VIVPHREPRDIAVSCVMSNFKPEKHPYLSTLEHIALAYRQWERLMTHWKSVLTLPFLDVAYEELVRDQDAWTKRMLELSGLEWDDRCSQFWKSGRTVMTLSYDQVSRPMYDTSIGRWKHYEQHLAPFKDHVVFVAVQQNARVGQGAKNVRVARQRGGLVVVVGKHRLHLQLLGQRWNGLQRLVVEHDQAHAL